MGETSKVKTGTTYPPLLLPDAGSTAAIVISRAMDYCAQKMGLGSAQVALARLRAGDHSVCQYCHYSIARQVAESLGALNKHVKSVYMVDPDENPEDLCFAETSALAPLYLLARVDQKTGDIPALLGGLDRALAQGLAELAGRSPTAHVLDIQVIDDEEIEAGTGSAVLLFAMHNRPLKVWER